MAMDPVPASVAKSGQGGLKAPGLFVLLRDRRFFPLFVIQVSLAFNASLLVTQALGTYVKLAQVLGVLVAPVLLAGVAGQLVDKYDNARLLRAVTALEIAVVGLVCFGLALPSVVLVLCAFGLLAVLITLISLARSALTSRLLAEDELVGGNVLLATGSALALVAGVLASALPGAGAVVFAFWVFPVCAFMAFVGHIASRYLPNVPSADPGTSIHFNPLMSIAPSDHALRIGQTSLYSFFGIAWFWASGGLLLVQLWRLASPASDAQTLVVLLSVVALCGVVAGLLLSARLSEGSLEFGLAPVGGVGQAIVALDLAFLSAEFVAPGDATGVLLGSSRDVRTLLDLFAFSAFGGLILPSLNVQLQTQTYPALRGRLLSLCVVIVSVSLSVAGGIALSAISTGAVFVGLAACALLAGAWAYRCEAHLTLRFLAWLLIHSFYRVGKSGFEHIPRSGPAVLVCNHVSFVDSVVIMAAIRRPIRFVMDHRIHRTPVVGFLFRHSRTIPIATAKEDPAMKEAAFEEVARALRDGELIGLFPEGRITHTGEINHFRYGVGRIVAETPVPVVPMALRGLWGSFFSRRYGPAMSRPSLLRWLAKVELVVGEPVVPENGTPEHLQEIVTELRGGVV